MDSQPVSAIRPSEVQCNLLCVYDVALRYGAKSVMLRGFDMVVDSSRNVRPEKGWSMWRLGKCPRIVPNLAEVRSNGNVQPWW